MNDFDERQKNDLEWLAEKGSLVIKDDVISLYKKRAFILKNFYDEGYICLSHFEDELLKRMIKENQVRTTGGLLSEPEYQFIDYVLNKKEFSNGLDLRNKYIHDTCKPDEKVQRHDYAILMKIMILLIIKMNDEFCVRDDSIRKGGEGYYDRE